MSEVLIDGMPVAFDPNQQGFIEEVEALRYYYVDYGLKWFDELDPHQLWSGVGGAFVGSQVLRPDKWPGASDEVKAYFIEKAQPILAKDYASGYSKAVELAKRVGRIAGAISIGADDTQPPVVIQDENLIVEGYTIGHDGVSGQVIEYGMGIRGFDSHVFNLRTGKYAVYDVVHGAAEAEVLDAARDYVGIRPDQMMNASGGLELRIEEVRAAGYRDAADLVIASRTHAAGPETMRYGIEQASVLLRPGGLLIACGPSRATLARSVQLYDYDETPLQLAEMPNMEIVLNESFDTPTPYTEAEPNRLVVARKV